MYTARKFSVPLAGCAVLLGSVAFVGSVAGAAQDKYSVKVPGGLDSPSSRAMRAGRRWPSATTTARRQ